MAARDLDRHRHRHHRRQGGAGGPRRARCSRTTPRPIRPGGRGRDGSSRIRRTGCARVVAALGGFAAAHDLAGLRGIGLTGQVNTHVFVDAGVRPVRPAIVWQDGRAAAEAAALDATISAAEKLAWFGAPMPVDASHALARMAWVVRHEPEAWARDGARAGAQGLRAGAADRGGGGRSDRLGRAGRARPRLRRAVDRAGPGGARAAGAACRSAGCGRRGARRAAVCRRAGDPRHDGRLGGDVRGRRRRGRAGDVPQRHQRGARADRAGAGADARG